MSNDISTVSVVFGDLSDAFDELSTQKLSPRKVRTTLVSGGAHNMNDLVEIAREPPLVSSSFDELY
jgi:hypothetical protein